ncbi:MAG: thioredoxin family protein [Rhodospirillales bacterium]|nr:thioredoxin family protein [Rhodospirillales bacterium]
MLDRRSFVLGSGFAVAAATVALSAAAAPFSAAAFVAAQASGKPVLVAVHAPWCPTCTAQKPILSSLLGQPRFRDFVVLDVDFDSQKDVVREVQARMQSTLIVYRGKEERGRSVGDTNGASIEALLAKAL